MRKTVCMMLSCMGVSVILLSGCALSDIGEQQSNVKKVDTSFASEVKDNDNLVQDDEAETGDKPESEIDANATEISINFKDMDLSVDVPDDFFDYRYWLGADVSVLGIDKESLKRQTGWIEIGDAEAMGYSGVAKMQYNIDTDEIKKVWFPLA